MNEEIKEILEQLEWYKKIGKKDVMFPEYLLTNKKAFILLDYITNLQQENERLKDELETMTFTSKVKQEAVDSLISRIDKAVEYFKYQLENLDFYEDIKARMLCAMGITLLQNGSEENG